MSTEIILAIIGAVVSGIAGLWKAIQWGIEKLDARYQKQLEERNAEREKIIAKQEQLESKMEAQSRESIEERRRIIGIVLECKKEGCETTKKLAEYLQERKTA